MAEEEATMARLAYKRTISYAPVDNLSKRGTISSEDTLTEEDEEEEDSPSYSKSTSGFHPALRRRNYTNADLFPWENPDVANQMYSTGEIEAAKRCLWWLDFQTNILQLILSPDTDDHVQLRAGLPAPTSEGQGLIPDVLRWRARNEGQHRKFSSPYFKSLVECKKSNWQAWLLLHMVSSKMSNMFQRLSTEENRSIYPDYLYVIDTFRDEDETESRVVDAQNKSDLKELSDILLNESEASAENPMVRFIYVPELSPVIIEVLGYALDIDCSLFTQHLLPDDWNGFEDRREFRENPSKQELEENSQDRDTHAFIEGDVCLHLQGETRRGRRSRSDVDEMLHEEILRLSYGFFFDGNEAPTLTWPKQLCCRRWASRAKGPHHDINFVHRRMTMKIVQESEHSTTVLLLLCPLKVPQTITLGESLSRLYGDKFTKRLIPEASPFLFAAKRTDSCPGQVPLNVIQSCRKEIANVFLGKKKIVENKAETLKQWVYNNQLKISAEQIFRDKKRLSYIQERMHGNHESHGSKRADFLNSLRILEDRNIYQVHLLSRLVLHMAASTNHTPQHRTLMARMDHLKKAIQTTQERISSDQQSCFTHLQMKETRAQLEKDNQVRKLTILAFIFIPVSAVTGFFGMNVKGIANHYPPLWLAGSIIAAVTGLAILLALLEPINDVILGIYIELTPSLTLKLARTGNPSDMTVATVPWWRRSIQAMTASFIFAKTVIDQLGKKGKDYRVRRNQAKDDNLMYVREIGGNVVQAADAWSEVRSTEYFRHRPR